MTQRRLLCVHSSVGAAAADSLFIDNLHPNRQSALKLAELAASQMDLSGTSSGSTASGAEMDESMTFMLKNGSSGLYLSLESVPADGTNTAYTYHMCVTGSSDMTHFTETGANAVAGLVANAIKGLGLDISGRVTS